MAEVNSHRPLDPAIAEKLHEDLFYDRIHSSAVTEGNRLSRRETIVLLESGILEGRRKDRAEVENLAKAVLRLDEFARAGEPVGLGMIRDLHSILGHGLSSFEGGKFRTFDLAISGSSTRPPSGGDVADLMRQLVEVAAKATGENASLPVASWLHWL